MTNQVQNKPIKNAERIGVCVSYVVNGQPGHLEFIARVPGGGKPDGALVRARRAVARRLKVKLSEVTITGILTY